MKYLVDTSALVRIIRAQVDPRWGGVIERGLISVCEPAMTETLLLAETKKYAEMESFIADRYLPVTIPDDIWGLVAVIRRELAPHGAHRGLSVADLVIAATAIRLKLTVLHEDGDFETVNRFVPELQERRISAGPD
ncbi:VapC toxin family PIN domain ribonuclease [Actinoplanes sp. ATCC 53533]|uniref:PIN domain-containing protein n=1 Tax=Actinoplanes sp. ATCC 53533 TaxID=1288362 RepID=UPI000F771D39|nr:PIN domain-containing protein [Actinoplanes sp. ATCC 53533]RSM59993.1 VapC toxin family PIN domain ribonuclease [Actinoplanes sp. ATCC 53533]